LALVFALGLAQPILVLLVKLQFVCQADAVELEAISPRHALHRVPVSAEAAAAGTARRSLVGSVEARRRLARGIALVTQPAVLGVIVVLSGAVLLLHLRMHLMSGFQLGEDGLQTRFRDVNASLEGASFRFPRILLLLPRSVRSVGLVLLLLELVLRVLELAPQLAVGLLHTVAILGKLLQRR
jgi:hypothetical protein